MDSDLLHQTTQERKLVAYNYLQQEVSMNYSGQNSHLLCCHWIARNLID